MVADKIYALLPSELPIVIGDLPSTNANAIAIVEFEGHPNTEFFGTVEIIFRPIIKIIVRHSSYETGQSWLASIQSILNQHTDDVLMSIMAVNSSMYLGRDEQKLHEFQSTYIITVKE